MNDLCSLQGCQECRAGRSRKLSESQRESQSGFTKTCWGPGVRRGFVSRVTVAGSHLLPEKRGCVLLTDG